MLANPCSHLRPTVLIEPPESLHRPDDPSPLALLGQYVAKPGVIRGAPEREIEKEEYLARRARQGVEEDKLESEQGEVDDVDVRFWVGRMEEGCEHIVGGRDAENWGRDRDTCQRVSGKGAWARAHLAPTEFFPRLPGPERERGHRWLTERRQGLGLPSGGVCVDADLGQAGLTW